MSTLAQLRNKIRVQLDILDEPSISDAEINSAINDAINEAESEIHALYEDYFLTSADLSTVTGQNEVSLPANIYGSKIRSIIYKNGAIIYEVKRQTGKGIFEILTTENHYAVGDTYRYILVNNSAAGGVKAHVFPAPRETGSNLTCWYLRQANTLSVDADVCDIPEFESFVVAHSKALLCMNKPGFGDLGALMAHSDQQRAQMTETLSNMVPDDNTQMYMDRSSYWEMS